MMHDVFPACAGRADTPLTAAVVVPPVMDFYTTLHRFSGLGTAILSRCLETAGCRVFSFDFPSAAKKPAVLGLPDALSYLRPYLMENETGKLAFFTRYQRFGPATPTCADQVLAVLPDLVFISCFAFCYAKETIDFARIIYSRSPHTILIVGGAGVSAYPEFFLRKAPIDFAVTGEAEVSIGPLLSAIRDGNGNFSQVPNLYRKTDSAVIAPSRRVFTKAEDIGFVMGKTRETVNAVYLTTSLSRGCPKSCRFCSNFLCHGKQFRTVPVETVRAGLSSIELSRKQQEKNLFINIEDDNLLLAPDYFFEILRIMKTRFPSARFLAENGLDYTRLTPELTERLITCGMRQFNLSLSSIDPAILDRENRDAHLPAYVSLVRLLAERGIPSITYFICGFANDTIETVTANMAFLANVSTRIGISLFYPVPGIPDFEDKQKFDNHEPALCAGSSAYPWNRSLTTAQMITAFRLCRFINLLKSDQRTDADNRMIAEITDEKTLYTTIRGRKETKIIPVPNMDKEMVDRFFYQISRRFP